MYNMQKTKLLLQNKIALKMSHILKEDVKENGMVEKNAGMKFIIEM